MPTVDDLLTEDETLADVVKRLGNVPLQRIMSRPAPGTAKIEDIIAMEGRARKRSCELVDGVLVEKATSPGEALMASWLGYLLCGYLEKHDLGIALGGDGALRLFPEQVRIPDLSFISWDRLPGGKLPDDHIAAIAPNLAVENMSKGNTKAEMDRKLSDYFEAGVEIVWIIYPLTQHAEIYSIYSSSTKKRCICKQYISNGESLTAETILPGFAVPLESLFNRNHGKRKQ